MMNELQISHLENTDISNWDFDQLRAELQSRLDAYAGIAYTEDSIKDAKNDRAALNKEKDIIEKARKAYKARCLAPYEAVEPKIKELVGMVERQRAPIDEIVKEHESRQKEAKEAEVRKYYDRKAVVLGDLAEELYPKLFDKKWTNASTRRAYYEEGVQAAINKAHDEIEAVKAMASPFTVPLLKVYAETLSMDAVREKNAELTAAVSAAGLTTAEEAAAAAGAAAPAPAVKEQPPASVEEGVAMRIYASQSDMSQLLDFMKAIGVRYEYL